MKVKVEILALAASIGMMAAPVSAQEGAPFVHHRMCEIAPGQGAAARTLGRDFLKMLGTKYPDLQVSVAENVLVLPRGQTHFAIVFTDLAAFQTFWEALAVDADWRALLGRTVGVLDGCTDELLRLVR